ncbi:MAG: energy-coupling factor ABC transporter ATP-binding protein [Acidimicrobiia bacterium]|nr:energy-coupling factor ABC transporter ATP-binding protein [Acidimicrobiia bacterium]
MISFDRVTVTYPGSDRPTLSDVSFEVPEGELCLVVGPTGSGKSTLLRAVNGLVPRFTGGSVAGTVTVGGRDTAGHTPRELADVVGYVGQDPAAGFVTDHVEDELAYAMENLGIAPDVMRRRIEDVLDLLALHDLRDRPLSTLSGGQQQRVAIGAALAAGSRILILDEPTSALDPAAAEDVLAALARLVHDLGVTVLVVEHRLERVAQFADRVIEIPGDGRRVVIGLPSEILPASATAPPVAVLGRMAGWSPVPLTVRDARRRAESLRERLAGLDAATFAPERAPLGARTVSVRGLRAAYGPIVALRSIDLDLHSGEVVAVMGRNGSGKSTLLEHIVGLRTPVTGRIEVGGAQPHRLEPRHAIRRVGLVPQDNAVLLYHDTVAAECAAADADADAVPGTTRRILDRIVDDVDPQVHPRDLSEGQRLCLAMAIVLSADPPVLLLDEPTRGLDYGAKRRLGAVLSSLAAEGRTVVLATHDVEVVASVADRCVVLADGDVVADGPAREVVVHSPVFAPQVAKIMAPQDWLTVDEVAAALAVAEAS